MVKGYKIQQVETYRGIGLHGVVTTCVDRTKYGCEIDMDESKIWIHVQHKGKIVSIPEAHVKQILWVEDVPDLKIVS